MIAFQYNASAHNVVLRNENCWREGGELPPGEGAFGHPIEDFRAAAYGRVIAEPCGTRHRLVSDCPIRGVVR